VSFIGKELAGAAPVNTLQTSGTWITDAVLGRAEMIGSAVRELLAAAC
jgi:hypothetical protein